jgi:NAD(P)-dependent dehydrogenase (short-subunit alcohol dehydrogenase family)
MHTILITGASSGFGKEAARHFARAGWNVVATMRTPDPAALGATDAARVLVTRLDVADSASIDAAVAAGIAAFGHIDVVLNNAGYGLFGIFEATARSAIEQQFATNVFGVMDVCRAILPHFRSRKAGTIINVSSGAGVIGFPMASLYSASKFALEGFSEALSHELDGLGIRVKIIEPGGAPQTGFMARAGAEGAAAAPIDDYAPFAGRTGALDAGMGAAADPDAVAKVVAAIFAAATDGLDQLRYTPTSDILPLLDARRSASEAQYRTLTRAMFTPAM